MLDCYRTRRRLGAYLDAALETAEASSTAVHLFSCARCQREVGELQRLRALLRDYLTPADPDWTLRAAHDPSVRCVYRCDGTE